jgi:hypothetical protein
MTMWMIWQRMCQLTFVIYTNQILGNLDIRGSPTYKLDEAWFLLVNFWYMMVDYEKWLSFLPTYNANVILWQKTKPPLKNFMLHKESRICLVKMNTSVDYIGPSDNAPWLNTSLMTSPSPMLHVFQMLLGTKKLFIKEFDILNVNIIFQTMT